MIYSPVISIPHAKAFRMSSEKEFRKKFWGISKQKA
jgi:hypothetical protein